jgi:hypothetical protein
VLQAESIAEYFKLFVKKLPTQFLKYANDRSPKWRIHVYFQMENERKTSTAQQEAMKNKANDLM